MPGLPRNRMENTPSLCEKHLKKACPCETISLTEILSMKKHAHLWRNIII